MLASLSSILRLIKINLRCLSVCKIDLQDIVSPEECAEFQQLEGKLDAEALKNAVEDATTRSKEEAHAKAQEMIESKKVNLAAEEAKDGEESKQVGVGDAEQHEPKAQDSEVKEMSVE